MSFQIGGGKVAPIECTDDPILRSWSEDIAYYLNLVIENGGADERFGIIEGDTPGRWGEKVAGESVFVPETHQEVFWQNTGGVISLFTVAGGEGGGGGDTYQVKLTFTGLPGFLDTKIHADTWEPTDTYSSGTHFTILAAPVSVALPVGDAVRFYAPYNIIKTGAGDGSPGYLHDKFNETGTFSASTHILAAFQNLGSKIRAFVAKSDVNVLIEEYIALDVQVVAITGSIAASAWNATTAKLTPTPCEFPVFYEHPDLDGTLTIDEDTTLEFTADLSVVVAAPATGKFKRGLVIGGKLNRVQCEEENLPVGWGA